MTRYALVHQPRPEVRRAHLVYLACVRAEPQIMGWTGAWLLTHGRATLGECTDTELAAFEHEVMVERLRLTTERRAAERKRMPALTREPLTVTEIREAEERARAEAVIRSDEEDWARERLRRSLDDAVHAARLTWLAMGGELKEMPGLDWAPIKGDPFEAVTR